VTLALMPDDNDRVMTVASGQKAVNKELGLDLDEPKSVMKLTRSVPLIVIDVFDIVAGQNTAVLLAKSQGC